MLSGCVPVAPPASGMAWYDQWLKTHVTAAGVVNYKNMKADEALLQSLLQELAIKEPSATVAKNEQLAYWINLYNAATLQLVLQHYPLRSIRELNDGKPWDLEFITVSGRRYSLNYIENEILRKRFSEPRIHFAINCAAKSCPKLLNGAFKPEQLEVQLNTLTNSFINDASKNKITAGKVEVSEIFNWYAKDFMLKGSVIDFLNGWSATRIAPSATIQYLTYDWSLNDAP